MRGVPCWGSFLPPSLLLLLGPPPLSAAPQPPAARDAPIATAGSAVYLDGPDWVATGAGSAWTTAECSFAPNRDYNPQGNSSKVAIASSHYRMDRAACCASCGSTDGCAAAVFRGEDCPAWKSLCRGHCTFRSAEDVARGAVTTTDNSTACIPTGKRRTPTISINATVPGDLVTDLQRAGVIADPLRDANFKNTTWWNGRRWTYTKTFTWPASGDAAEADAAQALLVFEGVKMGAAVSLNGHALTEPIEGPAGNITDQFLRYTYEVGSLLRASNTLSVVFDQDIDTNARFMVRIAPSLLALALPVYLRPS